MNETAYCIRRYRTGDENSIAELMNRAFRSGDTSAEKMTADWWTWKYSRNPAGFHSLVADGPQGIVGHYGGVPIVMHADGESVQFGQNCDSCTDPEVRDALRNPGLFVKLGQAYASTYATPGEDAVMYGLPNKRVLRIGHRYLDYWVLRQQFLLVADDDRSLPPFDESVQIEDVDQFPDDIGSLSVDLQDQYRCMARRDHGFLQWRFCDSPHTDYHLAVARTRNEGTLRGYAVYRTAEFADRECGILVDWLVHPDDRAAAGNLARWGAFLSHKRVAELVFLCPTTSPWFDTFQEWGFRVDPSPYMMTARPYDKRFPPKYLRDHWYYTLADFDVV